MLESHHTLVVKALQQLYTICVNNKCFPGDPIDAADGLPLTHAILDRLGLIKQAEEASGEIEDTISGPFQHWRTRQTSSESADTEACSPEPPCPLEVSSLSSADSASSSEFDTVKSEAALNEMAGTYNRVYHCNQPIVPFEEEPPGAQIAHFNHAIAATGFPLEGECQPAQVNDGVNLRGCVVPAAWRDDYPMVSVPDPHPVNDGTYPGVLGFVYQASSDGFAGTEHQYFWAPGL